MKDENDIRLTLKLNTDSLGLQLEMLTDIVERMEKYAQMINLQTEAIKMLTARVVELEKKREWVN